YREQALARAYAAVLLLRQVPRVHGGTGDPARRAGQNGLVDVDAFIRDGYVVIRGAFGADTAAACRAEIWDSMAGQGIREGDPATWLPLVEPGGLAGGPFALAGMSPAL